MNYITEIKVVPYILLKQSISLNLINENLQIVITFFIAKTNEFGSTNFMQIKILLNYCGLLFRNSISVKSYNTYKLISNVPPTGLHRQKRAILLLYDNSTIISSTYKYYRITICKTIST